MASSLGRRGINQLQGYDCITAMTTNPLWLFCRNLLVPWILPRLYGDVARRVRVFRFLS